MALKANVSQAFVRYRIDKKITFGSNIITCLQSAVEWASNLPVSILTLTETNSSLNNVNQSAMSGNKVAIEKRKLMNAQWNEQFKQTAVFISLICDGSVDLIKSTGFQTTKTTRQKKQKMEGLENFQAQVSAIKGQATASCKAVKGANGYITVAAPDGVKMSMMGNDIMLDMNGKQVRIKTTTVSKATFEGLPGEQRIYFSMFVFNTAGSSTLTDTQSVVPQ